MMYIYTWKKYVYRREMLIHNSFIKRIIRIGLAMDIQDSQRVVFLLKYGTLVAFAVSLCLRRSCKSQFRLSFVYKLKFHEEFVQWHTEKLRRKCVSEPIIIMLRDIRK